jgi:hypothetical protein
MTESDETRPQLPPADFDFLVFSLRMQAEVNLGLIPMEEGDEPDLELARHSFDMLQVLQEKTKGNLTSEEKVALDSSVTELRHRFEQAIANDE